ncbi:protein FAM32A-like [Sinocyclocheilus rhinocerous]|uniref:protein FAM32A-like n=1 Tax=Sinocyclocheilus rhinocerous TaxID=307959 RepID=UPI0007B8A16B|nr:PREDICTED: protein FAM32A-like [Sinocyclocheilus rhinocerous]
MLALCCCASYVCICMTTLLARIYVFFFMIFFHRTRKGNEKVYVDKRTPAQMAFDKIQEKGQMEKILKKASKSHKRRVEDFNRHLDTLTEHFDIPKVSWTK